MIIPLIELSQQRGHLPGVHLEDRQMGGRSLLALYWAGDAGYQMDEQSGVLIG